MESVTVIYLAFMFIALYMFSFFILLTIKNRQRLFAYPNPETGFFISLILPAYNEEKSIKETIEHVCASDYPKDKLEIIVVNDGSTDGTAEIVRKMQAKYPFLILLNKKNSGKADSINYAIARSKGELVAVIDCDSFPSPGSLRKLSGYFKDKKMGAVTSFVTVRNREDNYLAKIQSLEYVLLAWSRKLLDFVDSVYVTNGPLSLYRKEYVMKVGGFDKHSITEDIEITWNLLSHGYRTGMCLDASVTTLVPNSFKKWFRQRTRWGLGGLQAISKYKKTFFRKGMFGSFILPFVSLTIVLSIGAFIFSSYLLLRAMAVRFLTVTYSIEAQTALFRLSDVNLYPSVILFYFVVLFVLSFSYSWFVLRTAGHMQKMTTGKFFNILFYVLVYLTLYPVVWFVSIYRFAVGDVRW